ncbi:hypothetical protein ACONUD_14385 [Microbulbifer harenosus]|uniref:Uncharacterized protein n=1 Tax=Microbulbifer harenosus TaxID=2576840 RepID=A0ABY2ULU2_9GAMM|nr:hypothetical protein [Microbulbifer harenosus]TLM79173.1 hypothetical protein FDY93_03445 [Microbulbifer harenosus]
MKKTLLSLSLLAVTSVSNAAVVNLGLVDSSCNFNGTDKGLVSFNGGTYLNCELPTSIIEGNNTVVLAKESADTLDPIVWTLPGIVVVGNGNTQNADPSTVDKTVLQIEAGAQIAGSVDSASALIISRGAQIDAQGSANDPIVFSSLDNNMTGSGEWGGLVLAGFGESNACPSGAISGGQMGDVCTMEGVASAAYFGAGHLSAPNTMSSGTLEYVVIAEGGHVITDGNEINGLTLYAVNSSTTINNVHVHGNQDDGVEFFGGNAAITNMWMTCNEDDSIDWDLGYQGYLVNVSIKQGDNAGYALELANNPDNDNALPRSNGSIFAMSIDYVGTGTPANVPFKLKEGTDGTFQHVIVGSSYDAKNCDETTGAYVSASGQWSNINYGCTEIDGDPSNWDMPSSSGSALGFSGSSFWSAPACD